MRLLICPQCATAPYHVRQHPEDKAMGFRWRRVEIPHARKPDEHYVTINGKRQPEMATLFCDACGEPILNGSPAVAISQWRDGELGDWEKEYSQ